MTEVRKCKNQELLSSQARLPFKYVYISLYIYDKNLYSLPLGRFFLKRWTRSFLFVAEAKHASTLTRALAKRRGQLDLRGELEELSSASLQLSNGDKNIT